MMRDALAIVKDGYEMTGELIVERTPVKTGKLANNWAGSIVSPSTFVDRKEDPAKKDSEESVKSTKKSYKIGNLKNGDKLFLTNSVPYAERVEFGGEREPDAPWQAPKGMLRISPRDGKTRLQRKYKDVK